jgi:MEMO1 family protein
VFDLTGLVSAAFMPHPPILVPGVGEGRESEAAETLKGIEKVVEQATKDQPQTVIVITPHGNPRGRLMTLSENDDLKGDFSMFGHPGIKLGFQNNSALIEKLMQTAKLKGVSVNTANHSLDHGALVPLYFLSRSLTDFKVVHIAIGWASPATIYDSGRLLQTALESFDERFMLLASGDLSHRLKENGPYGYHPEGPVFDRMVTEAFANSKLPALIDIPDKTIDSAGQCGLAPFLLAAGMLEGYRIRTALHSYEGPFGVGYLTAYTSVEKDAAQHPSIELAKESIKMYVNEGRMLRFEAFRITKPDHSFLRFAGQAAAGAFVSLHVDGKLRGCIGTISAVQYNLGEEIIHNAIQAAACDPRFVPVTSNEIPNLAIKVDVMGEMEPIEDPSLLDVQSYGVMIESDCRRGLLLPALEGINTVEEQLTVAKAKAGIGKDEPCKMYRFKVTRYE